MFPYRDENPTVRPPIVTVALLGLNVLAWLAVQGLGTRAALARSICEWGLIPGELLGRIPAGTGIPLGAGLTCVLGASPETVWLTPVTSMFLHGGWLHLAGNMLFLWVFGNNIEDSMGHGRFVAFYLLCGLAAAAAQVAMEPGSPVPMVGASGAISGVMGAYLVLYPRARVHTLIFLGIFITRVVLPAWLMLVYWFGLQLVGWAFALGMGGGGGGVAFLAHIGGFVAGVVLIRPFARPALVAAHRRWSAPPRA